MKDTLTYIVRQLVETPESVTVEEEKADGITEFRISVPKEEMGKIIGKEGKVIRAIRNVMKVPAIKQNRRIHVSLVEQ